MRLPGVVWRAKRCGRAVPLFRAHKIRRAACARLRGTQLFRLPPENATDVKKSANGVVVEFNKKAENP
eukprot:scaffold141802_cov33-Tisochrysis_lutea.AAC.4